MSRTIDADELKKSMGLDYKAPEAEFPVWWIAGKIEEQPTVHVPNLLKEDDSKWRDAKLDPPQAAGFPVYLMVKNKFDQLRGIKAFRGYGDFIWYTTESDYMQDRNARPLMDNRLSDKWEPVLWTQFPDLPYIE